MGVIPVAHLYHANYRKLRSPGDMTIVVYHKSTNQIFFSSQRVPAQSCIKIPDIFIHKTFTNQNPVIQTFVVTSSQYQKFTPGQKLACFLKIPHTWLKAMIFCIHIFPKNCIGTLQLTNSCMKEIN